jgi:hypothetical protein
MKGLGMEIVNLLILLVAIALLAIVVWKLVPQFGSFISNSFKMLKDNICKAVPKLC